MTAAELARRLQGDVVGDPATQLIGFAPADQAKPGDVTFAETEAYFAAASQSSASAIIVAGDFQLPGKVVITVLCDTGERYFSLDEYFAEGAR